MECLNISVKGVVQGVGFRPFIHNLAHELGVKGFITNTSDGVLMTIEGDGLADFLERLRKEAPPLAKIMDIEISPGECMGYTDFNIRESAETGSFTLLSPDMAMCNDCLREVLDAKDRRYLYPFINCTNCGPRYSITRSVPYDRVNTTMQVFSMCEECASEYQDPGSRRFHAQPNACAGCGPRVELKSCDGTSMTAEKGGPVSGTISLLKQGRIIAIKGLGGFHLACDAANNEAVERLREKKRRNNKPFALMAPDIPAIKKYCRVSEEEERLLSSQSRPIVLLEKREGPSLPAAVAPKNKYLGFMLPYTPLHYLLFFSPLADDARHPETGTQAVLQAAHFDALVMTSGNITEEPLVTDNEEALHKLAGIADAFLVHNRDIFMRVDDSVIKVRASRLSTPASGLSFIRRSRGYVPEPIPLGDDGPDVLGCGADLKNTFTLTKGRYAIPGQHIGDMENYETLRFFEEAFRNISSVYRAAPVAIAHDLHPGYLSTQWALRQKGVKKCGIQHHYAHIGSVMAENCIKEKVIGVSFDGSGFGGDGTLWGGEFLVADLAGFKRAGHIEYVPLPGGETAIREPWRTALGYVSKAAGGEIWDYLRPAGFVERYGKEKLENVLKISGQRDFSPMSSGAGRLFDAVAALTGICDRNTFEGEAAIALEAMALEDVYEDYPVDISFKDPMEVDFSAAILGLLNDLGKKEDPGTISSRFHNTVVTAVVRVVLKLSLTTNIRKVVLSGGVFQNSFLTDRVTALLTAEGLNVYTNQVVPCNDAGISLGQAYIMRERIKAGVI